MTQWTATYFELSIPQGSTLGSTQLNFLISCRTSPNKLDAISWAGTGASTETLNKKTEKKIGHQYLSGLRLKNSDPSRIASRTF